MADERSDLTLAFTLEALERLADPGAVVADARRWSEHVGAVSAAPNGALAFTRDRRIRLDFFSGTRTPAEALYGVQSTCPTERHVLVGVPEQSSLATDRGWEFQPVAAAAERAGWQLREASDDAGPVQELLDRVHRFVRG